MVNSRIISYSFIVSLILIASACISVGSLPTPLPTATFSHEFPTLTLSGTPTPTITQTSTKAATYTPTQTFTQSPTLTATPTPTLDFPVDFSTPLPVELETIQIDNVFRLIALLQTGSPVIREHWISGDGKIGFVGTTSGMVIYDVKTNQILNTFDLIVPRLSDPRFSANWDGTRFFISTTDYVEVWDSVTGPIFIIDFEENEYEYSPPNVAISSDGKLLAIPRRRFFDGTDGEERTVIYDIDTGNALDNQSHFGGWDCMFSPQGNWFLTIEGISGGVLWNVSDWSRYRNVIAKSPQIIRGFSPDDQYLVIQDDHLVQIYRIDEWKLIRQISIQVRDTSYENIAFSPDSTKIGILSQDGISVWDIPSGEHLNSYPEIIGEFKLTNDGVPESLIDVPTEITTALSVEKLDYNFISMKSRILYSQDSDSMISISEVYNLLDRSRKYSQCTLYFGGLTECYEYQTPTFADRSGGIFTLLPAEEDHVIDVIDLLAEGEEFTIGQFRSEADQLIPHWISEDKRYLLFSQYRSDTLRLSTELWDITNSQLIKRWSGAVHRISDLSDKHSLAFVIQKLCGFSVCGYDLIVYDVSANRYLFSKSAGEFENFTALTLDKNGNVIFSVGKWEQNESVVQFFKYDIESQRADQLGIALVMDEYYYFYDLDFSPDNKLLAIGSTDGKIRIFETSTFTEIFSWQAHKGVITDLEFIHGGKLLISASLYGSYGDGFVNAWGVSH